MNLRPLSRFALAAGLALSLTTHAQEGRPPGGPGGGGGGQGGPGGPGGRGPGREGGGMRMNPIFAALDANGDGVISADEIANAPVALKKLDKNGDGKITEDEVRPNFGRGGERGGGPGSVSATDMVKRLLEFDKNGDGKLSKDELPERMQNLLERADTDKDGFLSKEELTKMAEAQAAAAGGGRGEGGGRGGREGGERRQRPAQPE